MRLIDADALIPSEVHTVVVRKADGKEVWESVLYAEQIDNAPTIGAEPVRHARWRLEWETEETRMLRCSECKMVFNVGNGRDGNYCPNCGAKMDGERREDETD